MNRAGNKRAAALVREAFLKREPSDGSSINTWRSQLAARLDVGGTSVENWATGGAAPSLDSLRALAADDEFGPAFLTEIFADLGIVCMKAEDATALQAADLMPKLILAEAKLLELAADIHDIRNPLEDSDTDAARFKAAKR